MGKISSAAYARPAITANVWFTVSWMDFMPCRDLMPDYLISSCPSVCRNGICAIRGLSKLSGKVIAETLPAKSRKYGIGVIITVMFQRGSFRLFLTGIVTKWFHASERDSD